MARAGRIWLAVAAVMTACGVADGAKLSTIVLLAVSGAVPTGVTLMIRFGGAMRPALARTLTAARAHLIAR